MKIEKEMKNKLIEQRLHTLKSRYFELELDRVALEATDNLEELDMVVKRMGDIEKACKAVEAIKIGE